jgi:hypothetical protein
MNKKILLTLIMISTAIMFSNCRVFQVYTPDGEGGVYRKGTKQILLYVDTNYLEHCKKEGNELKCKALDVKL